MCLIPGQCFGYNTLGAPCFCVSFSVGIRGSCHVNPIAREKFGPGSEMFFSPEIMILPPATCHILVGQPLFMPLVSLKTSRRKVSYNRTSRSDTCQAQHSFGVIVIFETIFSFVVFFREATVCLIIQAFCSLLFPSCMKKTIGINPR